MSLCNDKRANVVVKVMHGNYEKVNSEIPSFWLSKRYFIALLLFWGYFNAFSLRANISIAVVEMTSNKTIVIGNRTITQPAEFDWDSSQKGLILGISAYGYALSIFAGYFVKKLGGCTAFGIGLIVPSVFSVLSPFLLRKNFYLFLIGRFLEGVFEILAYCSGSEIWAKWAPPGERSRLISFSFCGAYFAMTVAFPLYGFLAQNWGWTSIFYSTGAITLTWAIIWSLTVNNTPSKDKWISKAEVLYIQQKIRETYSEQQNKFSWKRVLSSASFWVFFLDKFTYGLAFLLIITTLPLYIKDKTNLEIQRIGFLSALPSIASFVAAPFLGFLGDCLRNKDFLTATSIHKLFISGGYLLCAFLVFGVAFAQNFGVCIVLLIFFKVSLTTVHLANQSLPVFMAPHFPSTIQGYISVGYALGSFVGTMFFGAVVKHHSDLEWSIYFFTFGLVMVLSAIMFMLFGSAEVQMWTHLADVKKPEPISKIVRQNMTPPTIDDADMAERLVTKHSKRESIFSPKFWISKRYFIALMLFWGYYSTFSLRVNISIAIVEMTSNKTITVGNETIHRSAEFNWDSNTRGLVLGMSSYGYALSIVAGYIVKKLGGSTSFSIGTIVPALLSISSPFLLRINFYLFLIGRFLEGVFEILAYCSASEIWSKWSPPEERSRLLSFTFSGMYFGMVVAFPFYGFLAHNWGWPLIFYVTGGTTLICSLLWSLSVGNEPSKDKWISKEELLFLQRKLENTSSIEVRCSTKRILLSSTFWTLFFCKFTYSLGFLIIVIYLPSYIKDKINLNIQDIGIISALPNIASLLVTPFSGFASDYLQNRNILNHTRVHKLFIGCGFVLCSLLLFSVTIFSNFTFCFILLILFKASLALVHITLQSLPVYVAPSFPSIIEGFVTVGYTFGNLAGITIIGLTIQNHADFEWNICFICFGLIMIVCAIIFVLFGSSDLQPWTVPLSNKKEDDNSSIQTANSAIP